MQRRALLELAHHVGMRDAALRLVVDLREEELFVLGERHNRRSLESREDGISLEARDHGKVARPQ